MEVDVGVPKDIVKLETWLCLTSVNGASSAKKINIFHI